MNTNVNTQKLWDIPETMLVSGHRDLEKFICK